MIVNHLRSLQALELAVRTGSLRAAGEQLAISPAAVGQRIKALEDYLGFDLLARGRSGLKPSQELLAALDHIVVAFRELDAAAKILDFQRVQEIHIVADKDWAELWLKPRLPEFKAKNPNIQFCVNGLGDVPLRPGRADCEIWFGESRSGEEETLLFRDYLAPVCSPGCAKRLSGLPEPERLEGFPLLHLTSLSSDPTAIGWPEWIREHGHRKSGASRGIRYAHVVQALEAVYSNSGPLICGLALVQLQIEHGYLTLPFDISEGAWTEHAYWIGLHDRAARRPQVQQFRSWIVGKSKDTICYLDSLLSKPQR